MNKERRDRIAKVISALEELNEQINEIRDAEQEAFDNMPEGLQSSDRGQAAENAVSYLEQCDLSDIISSLEEAQTT